MPEFNFGEDKVSIDDLQVITRSDLTVICNNFEDDLRLTAVQTIDKVDTYARLAREKYPRLPLLSVINGFSLVKNMRVDAVHKFAYSDKFINYAEITLKKIYNQTDQEIHFLTGGIFFAIEQKNHIK